MHTVTISKEFPVTPERLYKAWTSPEELKSWWHPMGNELTAVTNDLKEGGKVQYTFKTGVSDDNIEIGGTYETVRPNEELVYTWVWQLSHQPVGNGDYKLHIRFEPAGAGSRLQVAQENFGSEEAVQPHKEGWEKALEELEAYLQQAK